MTDTGSRIKIPEKAQHIIGVLEAHGFEAYVVGGCVRDAMLGRTPNDWDITTSAAPEQVKGLFEHTIDTGIAHGTVTVLWGQEAYEVTTYRIDGAYEDGRHPSSVTFTRSLEEDLKRRDFTINAMAYNEKTGLVDLFDGKEDLRKGLIRCVGIPEERFGEDALRILRAVRFAAQLDFQIDEGTARAAGKLARNLRRISAERIWTELVKLLVSNHPEKMEDARRIGITRVVLPEFDALFTCPLNTGKETGFNQGADAPAKAKTPDSTQEAVFREGADAQEKTETPFRMQEADWNAGVHTLASLKQVEADKVLRLTMLLHDTGKPESRVNGQDGRITYPDHAARGEAAARKILRRLRSDRDTEDKVCRLIRFHSLLPAAQPAAVRKLAHEIGPDLFDMWLKVKRADTLAHDPQAALSRIRKVEAVEAVWEEIRRREDPLTLKDLAVTGKDLIAAGMRPGKELGEVLNKLLEAVLEDPDLNERERLLDRAAADAGLV